MHTPSLRFTRQAAQSVLVTGAILAMLLLAPGCGGSSSSTPPPPPPPGNTKTQLRIGDAAVDSVIAFEVTIASPIVVTPSGGGANLNITVGANRLELSHMAGKLEPLSVLDVPQGTFTSAAIKITSPEMTFLNSSGTPVTLQGNSPQTVTVTFNPALTIGTSPAVLNVDLNVANSLATDQSGAITGFNFTGSSFNITTAAVAAEAEQEDDTGELEDITGLVTGSTSSTFTMNVGQSAQLTFAFDNTTTVSDGATLPPATNTIVKVEGVTKSDGSLFATEVEGIENQIDGAELEGLITLVTGNPATSLTVLTQDGIGGGIDDTTVGTTFTADVSGVQASKYRIDLGKTDFSSLDMANFPFDATTIHGGQRVEVESAGPLAGGIVVADQVKLEQQAVTGTVAVMSGTSAPRTITITLPADSAFAILSGGGTPTVTVFDQPKTDNRLTTINVGDTIRVRGLLFNASGTFNMVARRITAP
jgi:Domain of unknown function (DUF5666)